MASAATVLIASLIALGVVVLGWQLGSYWFFRLTFDESELPDWEDADGNYHCGGFRGDEFDD